MFAIDRLGYGLSSHPPAELVTLGSQGITYTETYRNSGFEPETYNFSNARAITIPTFLVDGANEPFFCGIDQNPVTTRRCTSSRCAGSRPGSSRPARSHA